ncbi:MAG: bifunctional proline dehydrogenase/L-glutamate gamma-semialdehyde dehydrogenase PutA [Pseudomonadota bacterium]
MTIALDRASVHAYAAPSPLPRASADQTERERLRALIEEADIDAPTHERIQARAIDLVERIRRDSRPGMMELFLGEYGLSSEEGVALMCLAEALLRVPDGATMDALIEDKIAPSAWGKHLGRSHSSLVNASTWALFVTGKVLADETHDSISGVLHGAIKRVGEPVIRQAVARVMKEMGRQFVLGETIEGAMLRARTKEKEGFTYSYDMLGEAAKTDRDARRYHLAYSDAIGELAKAAHSDDIRQNPGISIKLSALHPRYETAQRDRVMEELLPRARSLCVLARSAGVGLNIDAEEASRLDISAVVVEALLSDPVLRGWGGFGVVVQAYGTRANAVIDWLNALAKRFDRRIMVRLVKGAYWDTEIKHAQVEGHAAYPVFTQKAATDVSYICCAKKLLDVSDRIYPQFATHNAHTVAAVLELASDLGVSSSQFEFQRLHGMGEALHDTVLQHQQTRCRIYAPVGAHKDLLAYLVRRLLENGANSSFVNQIVDETVPAEIVAADPFAVIADYMNERAQPLPLPGEIFQPERRNSHGWDIADPYALRDLETGIAQFDTKLWNANTGSGAVETIMSPATGVAVGTVALATLDDVAQAFQTVQPWNAPVSQRADVLRRAANLYEQNAHEIFALLMREAGKTLLDCVGELREAVDFLTYYATEAGRLEPQPAGTFTCIAPWNFPLAIFTGQIAAALAVGNGVLAKPAEATPLIADFAAKLLKEAGVPDNSLFVLPGSGAEIGAALTSHAAVDGVCFTGSTATAQSINRTMAQNVSPHAPLIAETGGLNAMIVDSTALPEQAITDIVASAFQSAGQRCSALRCLYVQEDIADEFCAMLFGAMDELRLGDPRQFSTDIGPIIDQKSLDRITLHIEQARKEGRLLKQIEAPHGGIFCGPAVISVEGIADLQSEIFGPVLHISRFRAQDLDSVIDAINGQGYGLTFGLHSRIDDRVQHVIDRVQAGNIYINRNQIGAVVGSQPFGGEGMSGTGPKAGGPYYLPRFAKPLDIKVPATFVPSSDIKTITLADLEMAISASKPANALPLITVDLPGPTGESNRLSTYARHTVLCLGPGAERASAQAAKARAIGCATVAIAPGVKNGLDGTVEPKTLSELASVDCVVTADPNPAALRQALALRDGPLVQLVHEADMEARLVFERHVCIDTTAAGGNAALMGGETAESGSQFD